MRCLSALAITWLLAACASPALHGSPYEPAPSAADFTLQDQFGRPFRMHSATGEATLLFFGYTHCPDVCPTTMADMRWVFDQLHSRTSELRFAFVTVDPDRDAPEVLNEYLARFHPDFLGLTGDARLLERIQADYGVLAEADHPHDGQPYLITHTARVFLIDRQGRLRTSYSFGTPREDILADVRLLLDGE